MSLMCMKFVLENANVVPGNTGDPFIDERSVYDLLQD